MNYKFQKTLLSPITFEGIGLHSGKNSKITILPADENRGIVFKRVDLKKNNLIVANFKNVSSARLCTTLQNEHFNTVSTVEHLLAALYIADIDNALIEINNDEVPILDGSAKMFLDVLEKTKLKIQSARRKYLKILDKVELIDGNRVISIEPNNLSFEVNFKLNYKNKIIGKQQNSVNFQNDDLKQIAESRTFCLFEDIEKIKKLGLAKGGSLDNAIVVDNDKILNINGLRNSKEFVNHKILDLAGDFLLSGYRVLGKINCYQGGHELTNLFLRKLISEKESYSIIEERSYHQSKKTSQLSPLKIAAIA
tara:strand:- start:2454 stop:3380 length:927 start_codon:yes stop_codon:yes gene_type:complete